MQLDPDLAAYFRRKQEQGKPDRVALVAASRKLLACIYVVLRDDGRPYRPAPSASQAADVDASHGADRGGQSYTPGRHDASTQRPR